MNERSDCGLEGACFNGNIHVINYLLEHLEKEGDTPRNKTNVLNRGLIGAVKHGSLDLVKLLIRKGASDKREAVIMAEKKDIIEYLVNCENV